MTRPITITTVGDTRVSTAQKVFGSGSALFDGSGDSLDLINSGIAIGTGDFTIEMRVRPTLNDGINKVLIDLRGDSINAPALVLGGSVGLKANNSVRLFSNTSLDENTWYHVALVKVNQQYRIYVNGQLDVSFNLNYTDNTDHGSPSLIRIGGWINEAPEFNPEEFYSGYLDEIRISNVARYTANFTPAALPFISDANTMLLIHADGVDNSTAFSDDVSVNQPGTQTPSGTGDELYIDQGYIDAGYYVYIANVSSGINSQSNLSATVGVIKGAAVTMAAAFTQTAVLSNLVGADLFAFSEASLALEVTRIRNTNTEATAVFDIATDGRVFRDISAIADAEFTQLATVERGRDFELNTTAAFSFDITVNVNTDIDTALTDEFNIVVDVSKVINQSAVLESDTNVIVSGITVDLAEAALHALSSTFISRNIGTGRPWTMGQPAGGYSTSRKFGTHSAVGAVETIDSNFDCFFEREEIIVISGYISLPSYVAPTVEREIMVLGPLSVRQRANGQLAVFVTRTDGVVIDLNASGAVSVPNSASQNHFVLLKGSSSAGSGGSGIFWNGTRIWRSAANQPIPQRQSTFKFRLLTPTGWNARYDDFRISKGTNYGISPASSTITVPTTAYTNDQFTKGLWHFDNNGIDDTGVLEVAQASLSSVTAITLIPDPLLKTTSAEFNITADFDLTATVLKTFSSSLNSSTEINIDTTKIRETSAELNAASDQNVQVGVIKQATIDAGALFDPNIGVNVLVNTFAVLDSVATVSSAGEVNRSAVSDLIADTDLAAATSRTRDNSLDNASEFNLGIDSDRIRSFDSQLASDSASDIDSDRIRSFDSQQIAEFAASADVERSRDNTVNADSNVAVSADVERSRDNTSTLISDFDLSATVFRIQTAAADSTVTVSSVITAAKTTDSDSVITAEFAQTAIAVKTVDAVPQLEAVATKLTAAFKNATGTILLEPRFTLSAVIGKIKQYESTKQVGAVFNSPGHLLKSIPSTVSIFGGVNVSGQDSGIKSTISFWSKIERQKPFDVLMSFQADLGYTRIIIKPVSVNGLQYRRVIFTHANAATGAGNAALEWSWDLLPSNEWSHYLILVDDTRFAGFGSPRLARLFVNGVPQGQRNSPGYFIGPRLEAPLFALGYNPYREQQPGAWGAAPYTTERNNTSNSELAQLWIGRMFHTYDAQGIASGINQFYNNGYVRLPKSGRTSSGIDPQIYEDFSDYATLTAANGNNNDFISTEPVANYNTARATLSVGITTVSLFIGNINAVASLNLDYTVIKQTPVELDSAADLDAIAVKTTDIDVNAESTTDLAVVETRIRHVDLTAESTAEVTAITGYLRLTAAQLNSAVEFVADVEVLDPTRATADLTTDFELTAVIGYLKVAEAELTTDAGFALDITVIDPVRITADLNSNFDVTADISIINELPAALSSEFALTLEATVIPPIRFTADLIAITEQSSTANYIAVFDAEVNSEFTQTTDSNYLFGLDDTFSSEFTATASAFKATGITADLQVTAFKLTAGNILNFDPALTLTIDPESRTLTIEPETRTLLIDAESRLLTIK